jgi:hypothetical protein
VHRQIIKNFSALWLAEHKSVHCWLFVDQLGANKRANVVAKALKSNVMCWIFPSNTSHFLQTLDDAVFDNFKRHLLNDWKGVNWTTQVTPFHFNAMLYQLAYQFKEKSSKKSTCFFCNRSVSISSEQNVAKNGRICQKLEK